MHITQILEERGFKKYRKIYENGKWKLYPSKDDSFSSTKPGGLFIVYKKGKQEVYYGLNQKDRPPTLIWPRPKGIWNDDDMNDLLQKTDHAEILESIL